MELKIRARRPGAYLIEKPIRRKDGTAGCTIWAKSSSTSCARALRHERDLIDAASKNDITHMDYAPPVIIDGELEAGRSEGAINKFGRLWALTSQADSPSGLANHVEVECHRYPQSESRMRPPRNWYPVIGASIELSVKSARRRAGLRVGLPGWGRGIGVMFSQHGG